MAEITNFRGEVTANAPKDSLDLEVEDLMQRVGMRVRKARELMFTGDRISAAQAVDIGLANAVVPAAELRERALELATRIARKSPLTLKLLKRTLQHGADMPLPAALQYEQATVSLALDSADAHEGLGAFLDKRRAEFRGE